MLSRFVADGGPSIPHSDGKGEDGLNDCNVELHHHLCWQLEFFQLPKEVHPPVGLLYDGLHGGLPL